MGETTHISWCDATFNPWEGCQRVSPGCENCYAEARDKRWTGGLRWGVKGERRIASEAYWRGPVKWNREAAAEGKRRRVFCASLADVFEDRPELRVPRARLWKLIDETPALDWLLLTKRPENAARLAEHATDHNFDADESMPGTLAALGHPAGDWPANVWLGVTAEDQQRANERIPVLLGIDGPAVRFVSYEPALGPVDFTDIVTRTAGGAEEHRDALFCDVGPEDDEGWNGRTLDWIIVGGESGPGARPFDLAWARSTVAQCKDVGVACFVKQLGAKPSTAASEALRRDPNYTLRLRSKKGADPSEWPADLRVQEHPR